jgi:two-component system heavy metal sensor histidine kinase CusS
MSSKNGTEKSTGSNGHGQDRRRWSLAARLTAWYIVSVFALILLVTVLLYESLVSSLSRDRTLFLADEVRVLRGYLRDWPEDATTIKREVEWESPLRLGAALFVRIWDSRGQLVAQTAGMDVVLQSAVFPSPADADAEPQGRVWVANGKSFQVISARAKVGKSGDEEFTLQVALDCTEAEALLAEYRGHSGIILSIAFLFCSVGGYWLVRRGIRPVREITRTARRIRSTTLDERIFEAGLPAELADLAETFNEMLDRLEESFARLSRFSADIAHELRTPLNTLWGEAEVALRAPRTPQEYCEVLGACLEQCRRLSRLVNCLLFLARAESSEARISREWVNVGKELGALQEFYGAAAAEAGITLVVKTTSEVNAQVDRTLLQQAVGNLIENALTHTASGGLVTVHLGQMDRTFRLDVKDTGRGIPEHHLPHVFDRFYRVDAARSISSGGVGLGLAIVKSIAELHGGLVEIKSKLGQGTTVSLAIPLGSASEGPLTQGTEMRETRHMTKT